ncbi:hypothetical protein [Pelomonas sp. Root662]|uniref:hypothetical protein n=1 Tax=Pelomonas sp. Root662 TaxID=1736580 RepID=UPI000AEBE414|nr:hypothetical protein [Pelomonas sp. Root662]
MVFLAITPAGLADVLRTAKADEAIWCGSDAITEANYEALDRPNFGRFIYELGDRELIPDAIGTIEEHHPGQTVWVEAWTPPVCQASSSLLHEEKTASHCLP